MSQAIKELDKGKKKKVVSLHTWSLQREVSQKITLKSEGPFTNKSSPCPVKTALMISKTTKSRNKYLLSAQVRCVQGSRSRNGQPGAQDIGLLHPWLHEVRIRVTSQGVNPWGRGQRGSTQVTACLLLESSTQETSGSSCFSSPQTSGVSQ